jgi:hypothetical protein
MRNGYGQSANVGKKRVKSEINWIEYDIDWFSIAKSNCNKCYGRGYMGYEPQTEEQIKLKEEKTKIMCDCVAKLWSTMTDEERLEHATRKENAEEVVQKAKEEMNKVMKEMVGKPEEDVKEIKTDI